MIVIASDPTRRRLSELLRDLAVVAPSDDREVTGLTLDSREVRPGNIFVALRGTSADGRDFIPEAVDRGAAAVLCERSEGHDYRGLRVPMVSMRDLHLRVGLVADRFFGAPSKQLLVVGITGTNGKSTCAHLLAQALDRPPTRCALIGTLGGGFLGALQPLATTTPDAITLHRLLAQFLRAGATQVCMEVSSHALDQGRTVGVAFGLALLTNLSRDHLDYHGDMERYAAAKSRLFEVEGLKLAVLNRDDALGRALAERLQGRLQVLTFGISSGDVHARNLRALPDGLELNALTPFGEIGLRSRLYGRFNAANLLAVLAALLALGVGLESAGARLQQATPVAGRVERFGGQGGKPLVVVDYAHTPDALEKVLHALREHVRGRLFCIFGCGGERDRGKRPQMGQVAEALADVVVLTDDNPRREPGDQIIADIVAGMRTHARVIRDRARAIQTVISEARPHDAVLVAGKGHEDCQYIGDQRMPYSDRDTVRRILEEAA